MTGTGYINDLLEIEVQDYMVLVTTNHPPLGVLVLELSAWMRDALHRLEEGDAVRVVMLRGSGEKAFYVGADIREFPQTWNDVAGKKLINESLTINAIEPLDKPVTATMEGNTLGGGCGIAMAASIRIVSQKGRVGLPEINLEVFPGDGGLLRLVRYARVIKAYEVLYTGAILGAGEALQCSLASGIMPRGQTKAAAVKTIGIITDKPFGAVKLIREGVRQLWQETTEENFYPNLGFSRTVFKTPGCAEGVDAFIRKRQPRFSK